MSSKCWPPFKNFAEKRHFGKKQQLLFELGSTKAGKKIFFHQNYLSLDVFIFVLIFITEAVFRCCVPGKGDSSAGCLVANRIARKGLILSAGLSHDDVFSRSDASLYGPIDQKKPINFLENYFSAKAGF